MHVINKLSKTRIMSFKELTLAATAIVLSTGIAFATTVGYTEGSRPLVVGTTAISGVDATGSPPGYDLTPGSPLALGGTPDVIEIYGRIALAADYYQFDAISPFKMEFIFGGYTDTEGPHATSGFVAEGATVNDSIFALNIFSPSVGLVGSTSFSTPKTSGVPFIFAAGPGSYSFSIDGGHPEGGNARYDIRITATTPLPATLPLFATGLGALGLLGWRRKRKNATPAA